MFGFQIKFFNFARAKKKSNNEKRHSSEGLQVGGFQRHVE